MDIPRTINDPIQFLFWSLDEIYPVAVGLIWGIWFDQLLLGLFLGWMAIRVEQTCEQTCEQTWTPTDLRALKN